MEILDKEYEFNEEQNAVIEQLAQKMKFVSYLLIGLGVLQALTLLVLNPSGIQGVLTIIIGVWTGKAAQAFQAIVGTRGSDITNLMNALRELKKLYTLQYWLWIVGIALVLLALVLGIVLGIAASGR